MSVAFCVFEERLGLVVDLFVRLLMRSLFVFFVLMLLSRLFYFSRFLRCFLYPAGLQHVLLLIELVKLLSVLFDVDSDRPLLYFVGSRYSWSCSLLDSRSGLGRGGKVQTFSCRHAL